MCDKHIPPSRSDARPDYGTAYVPNAGPSNLAPQSLDHFKRGYAERANQRDKEYYSRRHGPTGRERRSGGVGARKPQRSMTVQGLDINTAVDQLAPLIHSQQAIFKELDRIAHEYPEIIDGGKAITVLISAAARRKEIGVGNAIWDWMDARNVIKNTFHYNSMISLTEKAQDYRRALALMDEMSKRGIAKNEVTFSSAISACEKAREWKIAIELLDSMEKEGITRTAIAYNATISACEKGMVPQKACDVFQRMKAEGIKPTVVSYSALISAAEKGGQWRLALQFLEEMKNAGFRGNVVAYSAAISALAKGQEWRHALELFREIQSQGGTPSIVTYNATMTALEKGMQWELALDLFEEMKTKNLPITVVSYGSAISACDKGFQYRQCLEFLDEMTDMGIPKNVIIFGAAMSCMEKCSRADIGFELLKRMRIDGIEPNVHIYNSLISACSRSNLWEKGYELYEEMGRLGIERDVVTYNAVLDAVASQVKLGRKLFEEAVEKGFYARVSRLGGQWLELDLHFLSLGGGEIALGWWFEVCLVPYLSDMEKLSSVKTISIVTGYGKTRTRGRRHGDDGMRLRVRTMLKYMNIVESEQPNAGRIHIDKDQLIAEVNKNGGKIVFDLASYVHWKETQTTANVIPDVEQKIRARFKPKKMGSGHPPFIRVETESTSEEYLLKNQKKRILEEAVKGTDYRADIDYAVRDGIRFEVGTRRTSFDQEELRPSNGLEHHRPTDCNSYPNVPVSQSAENDLEINQSTHWPRGRSNEGYDDRHIVNKHPENRSDTRRSSPRDNGYHNDNDGHVYKENYDRNTLISSRGEHQPYNEEASRWRRYDHEQYEESDLPRSDSYRSSGHNSKNHCSERVMNGRSQYDRDWHFSSTNNNGGHDRHRHQQFDVDNGRSSTIIQESYYHDDAVDNQDNRRRDNRRRYEDDNNGVRSSRYHDRHHQGAAPWPGGSNHAPPERNKDQLNPRENPPPVDRKRTVDVAAAKSSESERRRSSRGYAVEPPIQQRRRFA